MKEYMDKRVYRVRLKFDVMLTENKDVGWFKILCGGVKAYHYPLILEREEANMLIDNLKQLSKHKLFFGPES